MDNHVHRATQMGSWVLINAGWYKPLPQRARLRPRHASKQATRTPPREAAGIGRKPLSARSCLVLWTLGSALGWILLVLPIWALVS